MCARFFYLILAGLFVFLVATVAAFQYLPWWQAILASAATFVMLLLAAKLVIRMMVGSLAEMAKGLFEQKSRVLKDATVDVHTAVPTSMPESLVGDDEHTQPMRWYALDVTVFPKSAAGPMTHWDVDDLRLVPFEAVVTDDLDSDVEHVEFELHDAMVVEDGESRPLDDAKFHGPQRLRFTIGVPPGVRLLKFRYYFQTFGRVELPASLTLRA